MTDATSIRRGIITDSAGNRLFTRVSIPSCPRSLIVLIHGFGDHSGRYLPFFKYFVSEGFAVASYDQRGHGRSGGRRGDIDRYGSWVEDCRLFVEHVRREVGGEIPLFIIGHSVGGLVALHYVSALGENVAGAIISAPALRLGVSMWRKALGYLLSYVLPMLHVPTGIDARHLSRDPIVVSEYTTSPFVLRHISLRAWREMIKFSRVSRRLAEDIRCPIFMLQEKGDRICLESETKLFFDRVASLSKKMIAYEGSYHEPLGDVIMKRVFEDIRRWMDRVLMGGRHEKA